MPLVTILGNIQTRVKDSFAGSSVTGLCLRANGEEKVQVIDGRGNVYRAGFDTPTDAPTVIDDGSGDLVHNKWATYSYAYASSKFPFVESDLAIDGKLWPRSNPSPAVAYQFAGSGNRKVSVDFNGTTQVGIDKIWIFRSNFFDTEGEAQTAGNAGDVFFIGEVDNDITGGALVWLDNDPVGTIDQVQLDNYASPQFQFCVYYDPYWWGFGNLAFTAQATWDNTNTSTTGKITIVDPDKWFNGRNGQNMTFEGITTGGFDGLGTYKFLWLTSTTATVTLDGSTPVALPGSDVGRIVVQGVATTLYRSKPRNPFSWGFTEIVGSINIPQQYAFKVGGGLGTALAVVPNNPTLKIDCEQPAKCYTLNLRSAGTGAFEATLRTISDVYSVSANASQFSAVTQDGQTVLWGLDYKNFAIVQSDGVTQIPISRPIPKILRQLTTNRIKQLLAHGVYDPRTELNCLWVSTVSSISLVNYLIYQHAPTGFWGFSNEQDVLCSAAIQDSATGNSKTFVGTQSGFIGQALVPGVWSNWLPDTGAFAGAITAATTTTISTDVLGTPFNTVDDGMIGNWVLITDPTGQQEQLARISAVDFHELTFDVIRPLNGGGTAAFDPTPDVDWLFYIGMIECRLLKYFDFQQPQTDKQLMELWLTQEGVDPTNLTTLIRWYRDSEDVYRQFTPLQNNYGVGEFNHSTAWYAQQDIPSQLIKSFGLEIINRGYQQWRFVNMVLKPRMNP